ncbi:Glutathione S-transferase 2 [Neonectria magnoliae]|uniref:Glutathione S-transferase 2 n=1 Tax=Neonectria magnoliae TaxID=2732573 RepID=A0ABR1HXM7_9HYPO
MSRPTGLIATKGIELLTWATPNGVKASVLLEELKEAYGLEYTSQAINIGQNIQKEPWFTAINPNGRIPAIVDHDNNGLAVFEGNAILGYLARRYDVDHRFSFAVDDDDYTRAESWIGWQHGGLGPMQGQANHFAVFAKEKIPYGIQRYVGETERLFGVLDARLRDRDYVVGPDRGRYSIADIALLGWANGIERLAISLDQFPGVKAWLARVLDRPAVRRGLNVPAADPPRPTALDEVDEKTKRERAELKKIVDAAKEQYGYKYASP